MWLAIQPCGKSMKQSQAPRMKTPNPRVALYKQAMALEEQRANLQTQLDRLHSQLSAIKSQLFDDDGSVATGAVVAAGGRSMRRGKTKHGALKAQVLSALTAAGSAGVRVRDLAATLGTKAANIHSWFQAAVKKLPIKKIGEARYRIEGPLPQSALAGPKAKAGAKVKAGGRKKRSTRPLSKRGELASKIMTALTAAGESGIKVADLSEKFGVKRRNLFIWFATTGRKNKAIKKVGESHYVLEA